MPAPFEHENGIYFGLSDILYRQDPALGSSDHKTLAVAPEAFWHGSHMNPAKPKETDSAARALGRAVHAAALEGEGAFRRSFVRRPDDLERLTAKERAILAPRGETVLQGADFDRAAIAAKMIRTHPDLANALSGGYPEVSAFWTVEVDGKPVRCKARYDWLKPRAIVDLKSVNPKKRPIPFRALCIRDIRAYRYAVQAAEYLEGRARVAEFVRAGAVFGEPEPAWLDALAAAKDFAFVWVFWASDGPPLVWATTVSPGNPLLAEGQSIVDQGRRNFVSFRERFGEDSAWIEFEPLAELTPDDMEAAFGRHF